MDSTQKNSNQKNKIDEKNINPNSIPKYILILKNLIEDAKEKKQGDSDAV